MSLLSEYQKKIADDHGHGSQHSMHHTAPCAACGDLDGCHWPGKALSGQFTMGYLLNNMTPAERGFKIVCLCGSTRFIDQFHEANFQETLKGNIVLSIGCDTKTDGGLQLTDAQKHVLDILRLRKIMLADEVLVLNVGGYIGWSTCNEVRFALWERKVVRWWDVEKIPEWFHAAY